MHKYIMGIFAYQCSFPENTNNLKESVIETQQEKNQTDVVLSQENPIMETIAEKTNNTPVAVNEIRNNFTKYFIFLLVFVCLIGLIYYLFEDTVEDLDLPCFNQGTETVKEDFFEDTEEDLDLPCFNQGTETVEEDFFEDCEEIQGKKIFLCRETLNNNIYLVEEKEIKGSKTYEKYKENNIFFSVFGKYFKMKEILEDCFNKLKKITLSETCELIEIDYKNIMNILKDRFLLSSGFGFFFAEKGFQKISNHDFYKKKHNFLKNLRMSRKEFSTISCFFSDEVEEKLRNSTDEFCIKIIKELAEIFPKKEELNLLKIKYVFSNYGDGALWINCLFSYKNIEKTESCSLGVFFNMFNALIKEKKRNIKITVGKKTEIKINNRDFFEIPTETINFLKKETKNLILLNENCCYSIFDDKEIGQIIKKEGLEEKTKALIEAQDKKIKEYLEKNSIPERMEIEINELPKIMKQCLLSVDVLKD